MRGVWTAILLNGLAEEIRTMPGDGVIVLHTMGSHGPAYYQRYPDALCFSTDMRYRTNPEL